MCSARVVLCCVVRGVVFAVLCVLCCVLCVVCCVCVVCVLCVCVVSVLCVCVVCVSVLCVCCMCVCVLCVCYVCCVCCVCCVCYVCCVLCVVCCFVVCGVWCVVCCVLCVCSQPPPPWYGLVGVGGGAGVCGNGRGPLELSLAGGVVLGGRLGLTRKPFASRIPYNVARAPVLINFNLYFNPYT